MKAIYTLVLPLILLTAVSTVAQKKLKIDPENRYLLLATVKTSTMQKELDEASAEGFRIVSAASSCGQSEMVLFLERVTQAPDTYKYRLLATSRTSTMEKELNQAAQEGFRLLPRTITAKEGFLSNEIVSVLEQAPKSTKRYQYRLLATSRTSTLQKEVAQSESDGYVLVGLVGRGENMVIMEKEAEDNQATTNESQSVSKDSVVQFLLTSAATDFHTHSRSGSVRFREVRFGHVTHSGVEQYMLCGEYMSEQEGSRTEWMPFATIKTSGYEQWNGSQAEGFCKRTSVVWDKAGDLSSSLQSRLASLGAP
jgi:hypothetical protein